MAEATGLTVTKSMAYRGVPETWSNKYWLTGLPPQSVSGWNTLWSQLTIEESKLYGAAVTIVEGYGYADNAEGAHAVWSTDQFVGWVPVPGTLTVAAGNRMAGDQAGMVEWRTSRKNTRGKWIYLRKYFHGGEVDAADADRVSLPQLTAYDGFATKLFDGSWTGGRRIRSQKQDETLLAPFPSPLVTTRTLKRRGKRPRQAQ